MAISRQSVDSLGREIISRWWHYSNATNSTACKRSASSISFATHNSRDAYFAASWLKFWKDRQQQRDVSASDILRAVDDSWHVELILFNL